MSSDLFDQEFRECCEQIRSVLATQNEGLSVRQFVNDFKQLTFKSEIPYRRFGYPSLEDFLYAIPHVCTPVSNGAYIDRLYAVTSHNTVKVQDMNSRHNVRRAPNTLGASRTPRFMAALDVPHKPSFSSFPPPNHLVSQSYDGMQDCTQTIDGVLQRERVEPGDVKTLPPVAGSFGVSRTTNTVKCPSGLEKEASNNGVDGARSHTVWPATSATGWKVSSKATSKESVKAPTQTSSVRPAAAGGWVARDEHRKSVPLVGPSEKLVSVQQSSERQISNVKWNAAGANSKPDATPIGEASLTLPLAAEVRSTSAKVPPGLEMIQQNTEREFAPCSLAVPIFEAPLGSRFAVQSMHLVSVSHVISLSEFYVQLLDERHVLEMMNNLLNEGGALRSSPCSFGELLASLNEMRRRVARASQLPTSVNNGDGDKQSGAENVCFAALSSDATRFSRVQLMNEQDGLFEVYFVDTGRRLHMPPANIFAIADRYALLRRAGLAYRCRLPAATSARRVIEDVDCDADADESRVDRDGLDNSMPPRNLKRRRDETEIVGHFEWLVTRASELHMRVLAVDDQSQPRCLVVDLMAHEKSPVSIVRVLHEFGAADADFNLWSPSTMFDAVASQSLHVSTHMDTETAAVKQVEVNCEPHDTMQTQDEAGSKGNLAHRAKMTVNLVDENENMKEVELGIMPIDALPLGGVDMQQGSAAQQIAVHVVHAFSPAHFACVPYEAVDALRELVALMQIAFSVPNFTTYSNATCSINEANSAVANKGRGRLRSPTPNTDACDQRVSVGQMRTDCLYAAYVEMDSLTDHLFGETTHSLWLRVTLVDDELNEDGPRCCLCIDYGKIVILSRDSTVYALQDEFATCSWQTSIFALSDVQPLNSSPSDSNYDMARRFGIHVAPIQRPGWCDAARLAFARYTVGKDFFALLATDLGSFGNLKSVRLVDTSSDEDVLIGDLLISQGHAARRS